ncbi:MAG: hypothetical protein DRR19_06430 [Candidatus Parabeggiatoa sp. nov. 1]|nr:MAG: hypothetical protein DRR19_06430 [Gammaproteobacteria bacterium]
MELSNIIQYASVFLMALCLIGCHNWLLKSAQSNPFRRATIDLTPQEQVVIYVGLFVGTVLLMFWFAPTSQFILGGLIAIGVTSITSLFIILTLKPLLGTMREDKLSYGFVINQNFLLTAYLIIFTELSFLNWFKEITIYVQTQFLIFVALYSVLIMIVGIYLGIPKNDDGKKVLPTQWRWRLVIVLNPMIVVLLAAILVKLVLSIILLVQ